MFFCRKIEALLTAKMLLVCLVSPGRAKELLKCVVWKLEVFHIVDCVFIPHFSDVYGVLGSWFFLVVVTWWTNPWIIREILCTIMVANRIIPVDWISSTHCWLSWSLCHHLSLRHSEIIWLRTIPYVSLKVWLPLKRVSPRRVRVMRVRPIPWIQVRVVSLSADICLNIHDVAVGLRVPGSSFHLLSDISLDLSLNVLLVLIIIPLSVRVIPVSISTWFDGSNRYAMRGDFSLDPCNISYILALIIALSTISCDVLIFWLLEGLKLIVSATVNLRQKIIIAPVSFIPSVIGLLPCSIHLIIDTL